MRQQRNAARLVLLAAALIVLYFIFRIFQPFLVATALALVLTSLSFPVFEQVCLKLKGRRGLAALITCLALTLLIVLPFAILIILLGQQVSQVYKQVQQILQNDGVQGFTSLETFPWLQRPRAWVNSVVDLSEVDLLGNLAGLLQQASMFLLSHSTAILTGVFNLVFNFLIMIVTMFFLFRDGHRLKDELGSLSPVSKRYTALLSSTFREVAHATVIGSLVTAAAQGTAAGIIFWILGVPNSLFWGTISAFFSLIPVVGATIIWIPWALYFLLTGSIATGVLMIVLQSLIVGSLDNVLRPLLIEGRVRMHTLIVFFSIMGGIAYFGVLGMVFGPIIVALGLTLLEVYKIEVRNTPKPASKV
jgi:predicted PurR-regulated permease PerM